MLNQWKCIHASCTNRAPLSSLGGLTRHWTQVHPGEKVKLEGQHAQESVSITADHHAVSQLSYTAISSI